MNPHVCEAIRARRRLSFDYDGLERVVEPYCHGKSSTDAEVVRAVQVRGRSSSGRAGFGFGKLWLVSKMVKLRVLEEPFSPDDPDYHPDDRALAVIHCRV